MSYYKVPKLVCEFWGMWGLLIKSYQTGLMPNLFCDRHKEALILGAWQEEGSACQGSRSGPEGKVNVFALYAGLGIIYLC